MSKHTKKTVLGSQARELVVRLRDYFEREQQNNGPLLPLNRVVERVAEALDIGRNTVSCITREKIGQEGSSENKLSTPNKKRTKVKPITDLDDFDKDAIRNHIYDYYRRMERPTLLKLLKSLKEADLLKGGITSLRLNMSVNIPDCPQSLKSIQHYLKTASEHDNRDPVVSYWCRLHALQLGLKLSNKAPEETKMLMALMDWLEEAKKINKDNEAVTNEVAAQAHLENYALKLFLYADKQDREQNYGKNVVKAFYTAGLIYDVLTTFGELTEEATQNRKYAKWKAAYIHNCLKNGELPVPGPMQEESGTSSEDKTNVTQPQPEQDLLGPGFSSQVAPATPPVAPSSFNSALPDSNAAMRAASQLPPVPYTPDPNPGGFVPYDPSSQPQPPQPTTLYGDNTGAAQLTPDQIAKAQKYCKWASSALNYEDINTAITNLKNALELLQTGRDPA